MNPPQLTRICAACGLEKPLSAFLQIGAKGGTIYGNICATCRGLGKVERYRRKADDGDKSTGPSGHRIGAKEKLFAEKEQQKQIKDLKELYRQDIKKRDETTDKKFKLTDLIEKERKEHQQYIEGKKQGFLSQKTPAQEKDTASVVKDQQEKVEHVKQEEFVKRELQTASWDMSGTFVDPQAALSKYKEGSFLQFKTWLGKSAHMRTAERIYNTSATDEKTTANKAAPSEKKDATRKNKELDDYIDKRNESSFKHRK